MKYFKFEVIEYLVYLQIFYAVIIIYSLYDFKQYGYQVSAADYLLTSSIPWIYGVIIAPIIILFIYRINKDDMLIQYVLKHNDSKIIFVKQCIRMLVINLIVVIYHISSIILWSNLLHEELINWDKVQSKYFITTKKVSTMSFGDFLWRYTVGMIISLCIITMIAIIFDWISKKIIGVAIILFISVIDSSSFKVKLIFRGILPSYNNIEKTGVLIRGYIIGIVIVILLFVLGIYAAKRKEYLNGI